MRSGIPVQLHLTCLADAFYGEVGIAAVRVLEHAGCRVLFPESQTCCGQPPFNAGDAGAARQISVRNEACFDPDLPVISPSASCAAMMRHGRTLLGLAPQPVFELAEYLIRVREITVWPLKKRSHRPQTWAFHRSCHGRQIGLSDEAERLLRTIPGLTLLELPADTTGQCCGFGGAFSATHGHLSAQIGREKLAELRKVGAEGVLSGDAGCLMHLSNLAKADGTPIRTAHYAQILAEATPE
jgi:L-lactate dehydrogenase complex protein LldE